MPVAPTSISDHVNNKSTIHTWTAIPNGDYGEPVKISGAPDKCVQFFGTFGTGGSITFEGSNDPRVETNIGSSVWFALTDPQANAITKTAAAGEQVLENPVYVRPRVTAGDGTTAITVILCSKYSK